MNNDFYSPPHPPQKWGAKSSAELDNGEELSWELSPCDVKDPEVGDHEVLCEL